MTVLSNRFKEFGVPVLWIRGKEYEKNKNVLQTPFFLKGYIHMITGWLSFWNEFMSSPTNGPFISVQVIAVFNANECFQCCLHLFALCFRLCTAFEIFRFIKRLSRRATSFTMSNGEKRVSRICFAFKKAS